MFFNDESAAKWALLTILTKVNWRNFDEIGGSTILNISGISADESKIISEALKRVMSPTYVVPLNLKFLQDQRFAGEKDYENDHLLQGVLSLPSNYHSLVVLDEAQMESGVLNEQGVLNLKHLENLVNLKRVTLDYKYSTVEVRVDTSVLILSSGKSFLPHSVHVRDGHADLLG